MVDGVSYRGISSQEVSRPTERLPQSLGGLALLLLPRVQPLVLCAFGGWVLAGSGQHSLMVWVCLGHLAHAVALGRGGHRGAEALRAFC